MISLGRVVRRSLDFLYLACGVIAGVFLVAICVIMMILSVGREIGFNLRGGDEMTAWLTAASAFLGLAYTFRHGELIRVGLLIDRFEGRVRRFMEILALSFSVLLLGAFALYATQMVWDSYRYKEFAQGALALPIWIPQSGLALGVDVLFLAFVDDLIRVLLGHQPSYYRPPPRSADEVVERAAQSGV